jgi:hypothetical protein
MKACFSLFFFLVFLAVYNSFIIHLEKFPCHAFTSCTLAKIYFLLNFVHILSSCGLDHFHSLQQGVLGAGILQNAL